MWSGLLSAIPSGWHLCDGTTGTPDLRGMFVKGTAAGVDPGGTGGATTHIHTASGGAVGTSGAGSAHSHGAGTFASPTSGAGSSHTHAVTQSAITTTKFTTSGSGTAAYTGGGVVTTPSGAEAAHTHAGGSVTGTSATEASHTHAAGTVTQPTIASADGQPPFYALAFIMKL